jgi:uncharacterized protein (TIGR02147 family)
MIETERASSPIPSVLNYLDYRLFLQDWFTAKKQHNPRFSHRVFARIANQKSPSLLKAVIDGRRNLTETTLVQFLKPLTLSKRDESYFIKLVDLDQCPESQRKRLAWEHIRTIRNFDDSTNLEGDSFEYLSCWYIPAVRELTLLQGSIADPAWISQALQPKITKREASHAINVLERLGFIEVSSSDQRVKHKNGSLKTPHQVTGMAVSSYHRQMLKLAHDSIDQFEPDERHLLGLTVSIPESLLPQLKEELNALQERLLYICDNSDQASTRTFQIGMQVYPLSKSITK